MGPFGTLVNWISGEWMLMKPRRRANGGTLILYRSIWVTGIVYMTSLLMRELIDPNASRSFDADQARSLVVSRMPWFGALFAGIYTALYARFSSQWSYLAGLYNQIMAAMASGDCDKSIIASWKAAFMEDADELHLALKPMYAALIKNWSKEQLVVERFRCFFLQSTALMSGNSGTDARFPSKVRQNVVVG